MTVRLDHHIALRVFDLDRAVAFWTEAFDGTIATLPALRGGGYFDVVFGEGTTVRICNVRFECGAVELFEFVTPRHPIPPSRQNADAIMHFGITVDDVVASVERVEQAGGRSRMEPRHMGDRPDAPRFVYCEDPDGHVFELLEATFDGTLAEIFKTVPEANPEHPA